MTANPKAKLFNRKINEPPKGYVKKALIAALTYVLITAEIFSGANGCNTPAAGVKQTLIGPKIKEDITMFSRI